VIRHIVRMVYDGERTRDRQRTDVTPLSSSSSSPPRSFVSLAPPRLRPRRARLGTRRKANTGIDPAVCAGVAMPTCIRRRSQGLILRIAPASLLPPGIQGVSREAREVCPIRSIRFWLRERKSKSFVGPMNTKTSNVRFSSVRRILRLNVSGLETIPRAISPALFPWGFH